MEKTYFAFVNLKEIHNLSPYFKDEGNSEKKLPAQ